MKKILLGLMVVALTVALSLSVMAGTPVITGEPLTPGSVEHEAWELTDAGWVTMGYTSIGGPVLDAKARAFSCNPKVGICNKTSWPIDVTVHASVAQWVDWSISATRYDWRVRKPGTYAANSLTAILKSNSDVEVDFEGFDNLKYQGSDTFLGVDQTIETWYAYGEGGPGGVKWIPAVALNGTGALVKDSCALHTGYSWKLWNKIKVTDCNSACEYNNDAKITLVLMNQKCWIDPETGYSTDVGAGAGPN